MGSRAGVDAHRREPTRAVCGTNQLPALPALCRPAIYTVHNLSEVSLTQYELDSKSPLPLPLRASPCMSSLPTAIPLCAPPLCLPVLWGELHALCRGDTSACLLLLVLGEPPSEGGSAVSPGGSCRGTSTAGCREGPTHPFSPFPPQT